MKMTKLELRNEIKRIQNEINNNLDVTTRIDIMKRQNELLEESRVNVTKNGTVRYYLTKNPTFNELDDYLTQLINSMYDVVGYCY